MKRTCFAALLALAFAAVYAQGPNNSGTYYKNAGGKKGQALKTAMHQIIGNPSVVSYGALINAYKKTDVREDKYLRDWYSNITKYTPGSSTGSYTKEGDAYNREHLVPQSWFDEASPMKSDIVHVVPSDGYVNNRRSNYVLAEVGSARYQSANGYSKLGTCKTSGYSGTVFEPNDEIKGDIARIYFYMATCYEDRCTTWGNSVFASSTYPGLEPWVLNMFMRWSKQDPVDDVERARNTAVYSVQKNRNPFVDYPGLEDYVWGTLKDKAFSYDHYEGGSTDNPDDNGGQEQNPDEGGQQDNGTAESCEIALNSTFFGVDWTGPRPSGGETTLTGTTNGVTVVYDMAGGSNMYANSSQIRLYQDNELTFSAGQSRMTRVAFTLATSSSKVLQASTGSVDGDRVWTGNASKVTFSVNSGSGNMQLTKAEVTVETDNTAITTTAQEMRSATCFDLQGRRVANPKKGLYVRDGKKIFVR